MANETFDPHASGDGHALPDRTVQRGSRRWRTPVIAAVTTAAVAGGFALTTTLGAPDAAAAELVPFGSCEALDTWYTDLALAEVGPYGFGGGMVAQDTMAASGAERVAAAPMAASAGDQALGGAVGTSETGTNVQEEGVDEPALLKRAGDLVYTMAGEDLVVSDVSGAGAVLGRVSVVPAPDPQAYFGGGSSELLLAGDRVVVLSSRWAAMPIEPGIGGAADSRLAFDSMMPAGSPTTMVTTVDVSDPAAPVVVTSLEVEGSYLSARAADGSVRLVLTSSPPLAFSYPGQVTDAAPEGIDEAAATTANRGVIEAVQAQDWLPQRIVRPDATTVVREPLLDCDDVAHPTSGAGLGTLTVITIDPAADGDSAGDQVTDTDAVSANGENVYATRERLYVATTAGGWFGTGISEPATDLHGFDVSASGQTSYLGSGSVDGWLLGRWALSAQDGYLRVATTTSSPSADGSAVDSQSSVHVLSEAEGGLSPVGRVDGLGPGETIRAVRWFGDTAVVVTFEQTDPLYVVDLTDPAAPAVTGELKVTGYSAYLHPVGDGRLLGIGQEATTDGMTVGTKAELFDLGDLTAPVSVGSVVWEGSSTSVEWDSRAFTYLPERSTAIVPVEFYPVYAEPVPEPLPEPLPEPAPDTSVSSGGSSGGSSGAVATPSTAGLGPSIVSLSVGADGSLREQARWTVTGWTAEKGGGYIESTVVAGDVVVARVSSYDEATQLPTVRLALLDIDGLTLTGDIGLD